MTFRRIRHHYVYVFSDCAICYHYHFLFGMSFLTTKDGMIFRRIRHHHVYVFSDCRPAAGNMGATLKKTWPRWRLGSGVREMLRFYYIHFKELESRYMSPIQGILVGFHIMIHIPSTTCTMMCILYYQEVNHWGKLIA